MENTVFMWYIVSNIRFRYELIIDKLNVPLTGLWRFLDYLKKIDFQKNLMLDKYYFYINFGLKSNLKIFKFDKIFKIIIPSREKIFLK